MSACVRLKKPLESPRTHSWHVKSIDVIHDHAKKQCINTSELILLSYNILRLRMRILFQKPKGLRGGFIVGRRASVQKCSSNTDSWSFDADEGDHAEPVGDYQARKPSVHLHDSTTFQRRNGQDRYKVQLTTLPKLN